MRIKRKHKQAYGLFAGALALALYLLSNHFPLFRPTLLSFTIVDHAMPFLPESVWVYLSAFVLMGIPYFTTKNLSHARKYLYSFLSLAVLSVLIFWLWPTMYPRPDFPLPTGLDFFTGLIFSQMRELDTMNNCAPSLHVSASFLAAICLWSSAKRTAKRDALIYFAWAALVAVSTMTTKQHYFVDVISGAALSLGVYALFYRELLSK